MLHQQLFDPHVRQKVGTGHLNNLSIPGTIVFRVGHVGYPMWYLSSVNEPGVIKRKNSSNVTPRNILEDFTKRKTKRSVHHASSSGIIAVLISDAHSTENITEEDQMGSATVEYLDEVLLRDFLERRAVKFCGLLQKWVEPKGQNNSMIHAIWTPTMCKVTCLTNNRSMTDRRCTMYERAVTFDGADSFTRRDPVSSTVHNHIAHLCSSIAKHVAVVTDEECEIQRSTCYFKVRQDGKVVYMWSSSMRVNSDGNTKMPLTTRNYSPVMGVPHNVDIKHDVQRDRNYVCPVSNKVCQWSEAKTFITYKMIIQEWNSHYPADAAGQDQYRPSSARFRPSSADTPQAPEAAYKHQPKLTAHNCIPELIRKLENISDFNLYRRLLQDPTFLYKQVRVCSEVAQAYSKLASMHHDPSLGDRQGLGHFLDDLSLYEHADRPELHRPASARIINEQKDMNRKSTGQSCRPNSQAHHQQKRQALLPKLDLGVGGLNGKVDNERENLEVMQLQGEGASYRQTQDMEQHKSRLAAAREKALQQSKARFNEVSSREKFKACRPKLPLAEATGLEIFTEWKKECKNDAMILNSLKQRMADNAGAFTERTRHAPLETGAVPSLSARPPNSVRSSQGARPARQFSMTAAIIDPVLANELAYHQKQAAIQQQFLHEMIRDTKARLKLGSAGAHRPPDTVADTSSQQQAGPTGGYYKVTEGRVFAATVSAHGKELTMQHAADKDGEALGKGSTQGSAESEDECDEQQSDEQYEGEMELVYLQNENAFNPNGLLEAATADFVKRDFDYAGNAEEAFGHVESELCKSRGGNMTATADERLLAALHMATGRPPPKHVSALQQILPDLELQEKKYFLNVITDHKGYCDDAALEAVV